MSAFLVTLAKSFVFEWQTVTVAFSFKQRPIKGLPTKLLRPTITTCLPVNSTLYSFNNVIIPFGVQETSEALLVNNFPAFNSVRPSISLVGSILLIILFASKCLGIGSWTITPFILSEAFIYSIFLIKSSSVTLTPN